MHPSIEAADVIQLIVEYVGFSPSRFYLRESSRFFYKEISAIIPLSEPQYLEALLRGRGNPKFLRLEGTALTDSLIKTLKPICGTKSKLSIALEPLLEGRSIDELMLLRQESLETILTCSVLRMNVSIFDIAMKCFEACAYNWQVISKLLLGNNVSTALMKADALAFLEPIVEKIPLDEHSVYEHLFVCATKFRAHRCVEYLDRCPRNWEEIPGMLEACAYAGDLARVKILCTAHKRLAAYEVIHAALKQAIRMRHFDVAAFLLTRAEQSDFLTSMHSDDLAEIWLHVAKECDSAELLNWLVDGDQEYFNLLLGRTTLLELACRNRLRKICDYLIECDCDVFSLLGECVWLEEKDLIDVIDFCCQLSTDSCFDSEVELFLLMKGIHVRVCPYSNPVIRVLDEGFEAASFSTRIELIKAYLAEDSRRATNIDVYSNGDSLLYKHLHVTPLGALDLLGTPGTVTWTGKNRVEFAYGETELKDEWSAEQPNEIEIKALRDIKTALLEHGADPEYLFPPGAMCDVIVFGDTVNVGLIDRIIQGRGDVNHVDHSGLTPLRMCLDQNIESGCCFDITRLVLDRKADPNQVVKSSPPLSWVLESKVESRKLQVAELLVEYKADIEAWDDSGRSAMMDAIARNDVNVVYWLIEHGADPTLADFSGVTPLEFAKLCERRGKCSWRIVCKIENAISLTEEGADECLDCEEVANDSSHSDEGGNQEDDE